MKHTRLLLCPAWHYEENLPKLWDFCRGNLHFCIHGSHWGNSLQISTYQSFITVKTNKKTETELTAGVMKKDQKQTKKMKQPFLIRLNKTKCTNFQGNPLFQSYIQHKNSRPLPSASIQLAKDIWIVCFCVVHSFDKRGFLHKFVHIVFFCPVKNHPF